MLEFTSNSDCGSEDSTCEMEPEDVENENSVTGDEIWLHYYDDSNKSQNKVFAFEDEDARSEIKKIIAVLLKRTRRRLSN